MSEPAAPTPTRPSIRLDLPAGWFFKESYTLLAPDGQANVIASSEPLDPSITVDYYAQVQGELLEEEFPGFEQPNEPEPFFVAGLDGAARRRRFSWTPPDGVPVTQIQIYAVRQGRGYTATATTPSSSLERYEIALGDVLTSIMIDGDAADAMASIQLWERTPAPES